MILYIVIAIAVFVYYSRSRNTTPVQRLCLALFWPMTFLLYLFNMATGRQDNNPFNNLARRQGGRGKGRGRRR